MSCQTTTQIITKYQLIIDTFVLSVVASATTFLILYVFDCVPFIYNIIKLEFYLVKHDCFIICNISRGSYKIIRSFTGHIFNIDDSRSIIEHMICNKNSRLILDTYGGDVASNDEILAHISQSENKLTTYVMRKALSAGTTIALASPCLYMDENAYLGPTDPQTTISGDDIPIRTIMKLYEAKKENMSDSYLLKYYELKPFYDENVILTTKLLNNKFKKDVSNANKMSLIHKFSSGDISHSTPITFKYLKEFIKINVLIPVEIYYIFKIYTNIRRYL